MGMLDGRVALVTGAGRGIGRSIAVAFAQEGAMVGLNARSTKQLEEVTDWIRTRGGTAVAIAADLADRSSVTKIVDQVEGSLGPVEILVNNAGVGSSANPKPVVDFDNDFWDHSLAVNLTATYLLCKAVLPAMLRARRGRIINVASINGKIGSVHGAAYAASKHGVLGLTRTLAIEVAKDGITVNAICPGPVKTAMNDPRIQYDADRHGVSFEQQEASLTAIGRRLLPDEVAPLALYLASDQAAVVTGQAINICGGTLIA